jgi:hypothetical protein
VFVITLSDFGSRSAVDPLFVSHEAPSSPRAHNLSHTPAHLPLFFCNFSADPLYSSRGMITVNTTVIPLAQGICFATRADTVSSVSYGVNFLVGAFANQRRKDPADGTNDWPESGINAHSTPRIANFIANASQLGRPIKSPK